MANKKKMGRPTKLTPKIQDEIVELLKAMNYVETACAVVGISKNTYYDWIKKANESKRRNKYTIFRDEIEKAQAWGEARLVATINRHSERNWQAGAWLLEKRHSDRWGKEKKEEEPSKKEEEPEYVSADVSHIDPLQRKIMKSILDTCASKSDSEWMEELGIDENGEYIKDRKPVVENVNHPNHKNKENKFRQV